MRGAGSGAVWTRVRCLSEVAEMIWPSLSDATYRVLEKFAVRIDERAQKMTRSLSSVAARKKSGLTKMEIPKSRTRAFLPELSTSTQGARNFKLRRALSQP